MQQAGLPQVRDVGLCRNGHQWGHSIACQSELAESIPEASEDVDHPTGNTCSSGFSKEYDKACR